MGLTDNQERCATTFGHTLAIKAGAGSGKTFTLTERIINAYKKREVDSISQVCAITFTNAAANELKARISKKLKEAHGIEDEVIKERMKHDSYYVDNAWISTIHGFCSRILKESAVSLGIYSDFDIIPNYVRERLINNSINETINEIKYNKIEGIDANLAAKIIEENSGTIKNMIGHQLINQVSAHIKGWDAIDAGTPKESVKEIAHNLANVLDAMLSLLKDAKLTGKTADSMRELWTRISHDLINLEDNCDIDSVIKLIENLEFSGRFRNNDFNASYKPLINDACFIITKLYQVKNEPYLETVIRIARTVKEKYGEKKRILGYYDNDDLLRHAYWALFDHKNILDHYKDKFKIIMVDEFQDTDLTQFETIKMLSGKDLQHLCVVGDFQQSIYRFRGADVSIFKNHIEGLEGECSQEESGRVIKLDMNFRSHAAILSYVKHIFQDDDMFGSNFLDLSCGRGDTQFNLNTNDDSFKRINLVYASNLSENSLSDEQKMQIKRVVARKVATLFKELNDKYGHEPKEMALLLEKMNDAPLYAEEFNRAGLPSIISGGSGLNASNEIQLLIALIKCVINPYNTQSLATVLLSPLFALHANDLLAFAGEGKLDRIASIAAGLKSVEKIQDISPNMLHALRILQMLIADSKNRTLSLALNQVFIRSGYYLRKENEGISGLASIGNIKKGIQILQGIEDESPTGLDSLCTNFIETLRADNEAPGMLALDDMNCIQIMTIHASKGLEFPIVAVGGFSEPNNDKNALKTTTYNNEVKASYKYEEHPKLKSKLKEIFKDNQNFNPAEKPFVQSIMDEEKKQEEEERKRLLYVALTRAREVLIVADDNTRAKEPKQGSFYPVNNKSNCSKGVFLPHADQLVKNGNDTLIDRAETSFSFDYGGDEEGIFYHLNTAEYLQESDEGASQSANLKNDLPSKTFKSPKIDELYAQYSSKIPKRAFLSKYSKDEMTETMTEAAADQSEIIKSPSPLTSYSSFLSSEIALQESLIQELGETYCTKVDRALVDKNDQESIQNDDANSSSLADAEKGDRATNFGSAFHRLAEYTSISSTKEDVSTTPSLEKIESIGKAYHLDKDELHRMQDAIELWIKSPLATTTFDFSYRKEEVEFAVPLQGLPVVLEGAIDLYCSDKEGSKVWIVDYKTGGQDFEQTSALVKKHALQAAIYAYIALKQGAEEVDVVFARVEHRSEECPEDPQKVIYHFTQRDIDDISAKLIAIKNAE